MDLIQAVKVSASGMAAQSQRMKVISENIANANSVTGNNGTPYRRQVVEFESVMNKHGLQEVRVKDVTKDYKTPLNHVYDPSNKYADARGFVAMPNVDPLLENVDMRDAARAYEANMSAIESAKQMMVKSLDMMR